MIGNEGRGRRQKHRRGTDEKLMLGDAVTFDNDSLHMCFPFYSKGLSFWLVNFLASMSEDHLGNRHLLMGAKRCL